MMIYCVSDLHGRLDLFEELLKTIELANDDVLYVLGDAIDRGGGLKLLKRIIELSSCGKVKMIKGNHEQNFLSYIDQFDPDIGSKLEESYKYKNYYNSQNDALSNLGKIVYNCEFINNKHLMDNSIEAAIQISQYKGYETYVDYLEMGFYERKMILSFLRSLPEYETVEVSGIKFVLTHAGYDKNGEVDLTIRSEFYCNKSPVQDSTIIFGHTTTKDIRIKTEKVYSEPQIWFDSKHDNDKIGIDCGCSFYGGKLACLRLNDMKEFYIENRKELKSYLDQVNRFAKQNNVPVNPEYYYGESVLYEMSALCDKYEKIVEADGLEKYGKYYKSHMKYYPSLPTEVKDEWYELLKSVDLYRVLVRKCPKSDYLRGQLKQSESRIEEFYNKYSIDMV